MTYRHFTWACGLVVAALNTGNVHAQNLVPNPGFELFNTCPTSYSQMDHSQFWFNPTPGGSPNGSSDYFNACSVNASADVPANFAGSQAAHTGTGYAGLATYSTSIQDFREYIEVGLTSPLEAGLCYELSFFVSRGDTVRYGTCDLGALFTNGEITQNVPGPFPYTPSIDNIGGCMSDDADWTLVSGLYQALGGETHLTIGSFHNDSTTTLITAAPSMLFLNAYYYIDDVTVQVAPANKSCLHSGTEEHTLVHARLFPNPVTDELQITLPVNSAADLFVRDADGRIVMTSRLAGNATVHLDHLAAGAYLYELRYRNGAVERGRFIKQQVR